MIKNNKGTILVVAVTAMVIMIIIGYVCLQMYMNQGILDTYDVTKKRLFYSAEGSIEMFKGYLIRHTDNEREEYKDIGLPGGAKGFIFNNAKVNNSEKSDNDSFSAANSWNPLASGTLRPFDGTMHPRIDVQIGLRRLTALGTGANQNPDLNSFINSIIATSASHFYSTPAPNLKERFVGTNRFRSAIGNFTGAGEKKAYEIIAKATTNHRTALSNNTAISCVIHYYFYTTPEHKMIDGIDKIIAHNITFVGWRIEN